MGSLAAHHNQAEAQLVATSNRDGLMGGQAEPIHKGSICTHQILHDKAITLAFDQRMAPRNTQFNLYLA